LTRKKVATGIGIWDYTVDKWYLPTVLLCH